MPCFPALLHIPCFGNTSYNGDLKPLSNNCMSSWAALEGRSFENPVPVWQLGIKQAVLGTFSQKKGHWHFVILRKFLVTKILLFTTVESPIFPMYHPRPIEMLRLSIIMYIIRMLGLNFLVSKVN